MKKSDKNISKFLIKMALNRRDLEEWDVEKGWKRVNHSLRDRKKLTLGQIFRKMTIAAAVLLPLTFLSAYLFHGEKNRDLSENGSMIPENNIELIFSTGEHHYLSRKGNQLINQPGVNIMIDSSTGNIQYARTEAVAGITPVFNEVKVPKGKELCLELEDGTRVWLNTGSSLKFPVPFEEERREVFLIGEGYFEVKSDETHPFLVHAGGDIIKVTGTSFNVSVYPGDMYWHTTLIEGSVKIEHNEREYDLTPSLQFQRDLSNNEIEIKKVDARFYSSWMKEKTYFKNQRFEDIVRQLEHKFGFEVKYEDETIKDMKFRGVIHKDDSFEDVLRKLEKTTHIQICIDDDGVVTARKINE